MKLKSPSALLSVIIFFVVSTSCVDNINFDQANELAINPIYKVSLVRFDSTQEKLINTGNSEFTSTSAFTLFNEGIIKDNLGKVALEIEISNPFNTSVALEFTFLDGADSETYKVQTLNVSPGSKDFSYTEDINIASNATFLTSRKVQTKLILSSNNSSVVNPNGGQFIFKSAGTFYLTIKP